MRNTTGLRANGDFLYWHEREEIRKAVFQRDPPFCNWCGVPVGDFKHDTPYTVDHIIPFALGGAYTPDNLVLSCSPCNNRRGHKSILMFMVVR